MTSWSARDGWWRGTAAWCDGRGAGAGPRPGGVSTSTVVSEAYRSGSVRRMRRATSRPAARTTGSGTRRAVLPAPVRPVSRSKWTTAGTVSRASPAQEISGAQTTRAAERPIRSRRK
ncbi:hypothetical protein GCM10010299_19440 [Streptomyces tanashiensis]|nr:hypothetical protein GCM10010299_19440 [Streptomyces tanashiensis]